jgi:hypothetical protein
MPTDRRTVVRRAGNRSIGETLGPMQNRVEIAVQASRRRSDPGLAFLRPAQLDGLQAPLSESHSQRRTEDHRDENPLAPTRERPQRDGTSQDTSPRDPDPSR